MFCCTLFCIHSSIAIILVGKRELIALLNLSSWCLVVFGRLFLAVPRGCLRFVFVVFPDHTHLLFLRVCTLKRRMTEENMLIFCVCFKIIDKHSPHIAILMYIVLCNLLGYQIYSKIKTNKKRM